MVHNILKWGEQFQTFFFVMKIHSPNMVLDPCIVVILYAICIKHVNVRAVERVIWFVGREQCPAHFSVPAQGLLWPSQPDGAVHAGHQEGTGRHPGQRAHKPDAQLDNSDHRWEKCKVRSGISSYTSCSLLFVVGRPLCTTEFNPILKSLFIFYI